MDEVVEDDDTLVAMVTGGLDGDRPSKAGEDLPPGDAVLLLSSCDRGPDPWGDGPMLCDIPECDIDPPGVSSPWDIDPGPWEPVPGPWDIIPPSPWDIGPWPEGGLIPWDMSVPMGPIDCDCCDRSPCWGGNPPKGLLKSPDCWGYIPCCCEYGGWENGPEYCPDCCEYQGRERHPVMTTPEPS